MSGRRRLFGANSIQEDVAAPAASALARSHLPGGATVSHLPPPGFVLVDDRTLTRVQRRAIKQAHQLDCEYFRQNPLRLTRVRCAIDEETDTADLFPGRRAFVVVRQIRPGTHHKLFAFTQCDLVEAASSESAASELYDLMLEGEQREWSAKSKNRALDALLIAAPVQGKA
jgi:hypothetical protein